MDKIKEAAENIKENILQNSGQHTFIGETVEGIRIKITKYNTASGNKIYSAYPDYNN